MYSPPYVMQTQKIGMGKGCWAELPNELKVMIADKCNAHSLFKLEVACPELISILPLDTKTRIYFESVLEVLYENGFLCFEDLKTCREVCKYWQEKVDNYFCSTNFYSLRNTNSVWNQSTVILWLPIKKDDVPRLMDMSTHYRCPSFGKKLVLKYPFMEKTKCLSVKECCVLISKLKKMWNTFDHLEIQKDCRWIKEMETRHDLRRFEQLLRLVQHHILNAVNRDERPNVVATEYWDESICDHLFMPFLKVMENLVSLKGDASLSCLTTASTTTTWNAVLKGNFTRLKWLILHSDGDENYRFLIEKCCRTLEMIQVPYLGHLNDPVEPFDLSNLKELLIINATPDDSRNVIALLGSATLPRLQILGIPLLDGENLPGFLKVTPNLELLLVQRLVNCNPQSMLQLHGSKSMKTFATNALRGNIQLAAIFPALQHVLVSDNILGYQLGLPFNGSNSLYGNFGEKPVLNGHNLWTLIPTLKRFTFNLSSYRNPYLRLLRCTIIRSKRF